MNKRTLHRDLYSGKYRPRIEKTKRERLEAHVKKHKNRSKLSDFFMPNPTNKKRFVTIESMFNNLGEGDGNFIFIVIDRCGFGVDCDL